MIDSERLEVLLAELLDLAEVDRRERLAQLDQTEPGVRAILERRLARLARLGFRIDSPTMAGSEHPQLAVAGFEILRLLGGGGMGLVYEAEQASLGRRVALKIIRPEQVAMPLARERFRREAELASRLDHPGICRVYEVGEVDGSPFLAMQLVDGADLATRLAAARKLEGRPGSRVPLDLSNGSGLTASHAVLLSFFEQVARALHAAHDHGLIHRDVKPANIMVQPDCTPCLLDFGLARMEDGGQSLTQGADVLGTPMYMSPEQVDPQGRRVDRRTDIYSLGASLYESLTLREPHPSSTREALYRRILSEEPEDPRLFCDGVSRDLVTVLRTAMAKDRDQRYETAEALAEDLMRVRTRQPILAQPPSIATRAQMWVRRNRLVSGLVATTTLGLIVALVLLFRLDSLARHNEAMAISGASVTHREVDSNLALHLARRAFELEPSEDAEFALHEAIHRQRLLATVPMPDVILRVLACADGFVVMCQDGALALVAPDGKVMDRARTDSEPFCSVVRSEGDETFVYLGTKSGAIQVWRPLRAELASLGGSLSGAVDCLALSHEGSRLLVGTRKGEVRVRDTTQGRDVLSLRRDGAVKSCGFIPKSFGFFFGDDRGVIEIRTAAGSVSRRLQHPRGRVQIMDLCYVKASSPASDRIIATAVGDRIVHPQSFGVADETVRPLLAHTGVLTNVELAPGGREFVTTSGGPVVRIYGAEEGRLRGTAIMHTDTVRALAFRPDGERFATGSFDRTVCIWDRRGVPVDRLFGHRQGIEDLAFSLDGQVLASGGLERELRIWRAGPSPTDFVRYECPGFVYIAPHPDGRSLTVIGTDRHLYVYDVAKGTAVTMTKKAPFGGGGYVAMHHKGRYLVRALGNRLRLWDLQERRYSDIEPSPPVQCKLTYVGWQPGGDRLVVVLKGATRTSEPPGFQVFELIGGALRKVAERRFSPDECGGGFNRGAVLSDGRAALAGKDGKVWICGVTGEVEKLSCQSNDPVRAVSICADGRFLAAGTRDGILCVFEREGGRFGGRERVQGHEGRLWNVRFSGGRLLTTAADGSVRLWTEDGTPLRRIRFGARDEIVDAWISPDGEHLIATCLNAARGGYIRKVPLSTSGLSALARSLERPLRPDQVRAFGGMLGAATQR